MSLVVKGTSIVINHGYIWKLKHKKKKLNGIHFLFDAIAVWNMLSSWLPFMNAYKHLVANAYVYVYLIFSMLYNAKNIWLLMLQTYSTQQQKDQLICSTIIACPCNCFTKYVLHQQFLMANNTMLRTFGC